MFVILSIVGIFSLFVMYKIELEPTTINDEPVEFKILPGETYLTIANKLKEQNLIKSEFVYKIYIKLNNPDNFRAGTFVLNKNMGVKILVDTLENGSEMEAETIIIMFPEGKNMRQMANIIANKTNNTEDDVFSLLKDKDYLNSLIQKYWFLDETILDNRIYYSLEGYLFPDTYEFKDVNVDVKTIFEKMLNQMGKKLEPYKEKIVNSSYSLHQMLTLASIVELEASNSNDRAGVAGVFYNRLNYGWALGSDVTTYYAAKVDMSERDLYQTELDDYNDYNTRNSKMAGKLPVGPICNPGINALNAAIEPTSHNYFYFVADKNRKTYFSKTNSEHIKTVNKLKNEGLWYEY